MAVSYQDIAAIRGDTISKSVTAYDSTGAALNLTGCTLWFTVKLASDARSDDANAIVSSYWVSGGLSSGITVNSPTSGVAQIDAPATSTINLIPNKQYVHDVQIMDSFSRVYSLVKGALTVEADVTERTTTP